MSVRTLVLRLVFFSVVWMILCGPDTVSLVIGLGVVAIATWTSIRLLPPAATGRLQVLLLAQLFLRFIWESVFAGIDVAWRALDPRLPLRPGFVAYPIQIPVSPARNMFLTLASLLPGTLPTGLDEAGTLLVHCLDIQKPVVEPMRMEERLLARALGRVV